MKKLSITLALFVVCSMQLLHAQSWFGEGAVGAAVVDESFGAALKAGAGYEFNEKWALAADFTVGATDDYGYIQIEPYARYNFWNNGTLYFDCKLGNVFIIEDGEFGYFPNLTPDLRIKLSDKWAIGLDIAKIGPVFFFGDGYFYGQFVRMTPEISVMYKF